MESKKSEQQNQEKVDNEGMRKSSLFRVPDITGIKFLRKYPKIKDLYGISEIASATQNLPRQESADKGNGNLHC